MLNSRKEQLLRSCSTLKRRHQTDQTLSPNESGKYVKSSNIFNWGNTSIFVCRGIILENEKCLKRDPVLGGVDNAIHRINAYPPDSVVRLVRLIHWIAIYAPYEQRGSELVNVFLEDASWTIIQRQFYLHSFSHEIHVDRCIHNQTATLCKTLRSCTD